MTLPSLALRHVLRSARSYRLWFISVAVSACAFYLFQAAVYDPTIAKLVAAKMSLTVGMSVAAVILAVFTGVFMAYSAAFFVRGRAREIGLYRLFGIGRLRIAAMLLAENAIAGLAALASGLAAGIIGSKLFLMGLAKVIDLDVELGMVADPRALGWTAAAFCLLILIASAIASAAVFRTRLALVFQKERASDRMSRWNPLIGALSLPLLAAAYIVAGVATINTLIVCFLVASVFTVAGTWAFARGAGSLLVRLLRRHDRFFLKGSRMIALSNVAHRIGANARVFFVIALVSAVSMTALGVGLNMKYYLETNLAIYLPHEIALSTSNEAARQTVLADIASQGVRVTPASTIPYLAATRINNQTKDGYYQAPLHRIFAASEYLRVARQLDRDPAAAQAVLSKLKPGEGALVEPVAEMAQNMHGEYRYAARNLANSQDEDFRLTVATRIVLPAVNDPLNGKGLVVPDADWRALAEAYPARVAVQADYQLDQPKKAQSALDRLRSADNGVTVEARGFKRDVINYFNVYLFAGVFLGLVFLFCACSVLHFKQLMDGREDAPRFETLRKIGMGKTDEKQTAVFQVLPLYALPLGLAMVHGTVALLTMGRVLAMDVALPIACDLAGFALIFTAFAAVTTRSYLGMVRGAER